MVSQDKWPNFESLWYTFYVTLTIFPLGPSYCLCSNLTTLNSPLERIGMSGRRTTLCVSHLGLSQWICLLILALVLPTCE